MDIEAAVVREIGSMTRETLQLSAPRADEVLVRMVATGICHSDISVMNAYFPPAPPAVLGHEGAGIVEAVGLGVTHVVPGDHVVLTVHSCGTCYNCRHGHVAYCEQAQLYNLSGGRPDGSRCIHDHDGPIGSAFFGQSSFATYAIGNARNTVKVRKDAPLELLGPLGCGFQTGAGAVLNVLKPLPDSTFAVFGCGGVGLTALMAAKMLGVETIVAIDMDRTRLDLARELGATHTVKADEEDAVAVLQALGGAHTVIEASGALPALRQAIDCTRPHGICGVIGAPKLGSTIEIDIYATFISGKALIGIVEGDSDLHTFIPHLVDCFVDGKFPIDRLIKTYSFADIEQVIADYHKAEAVKPVLLFS